MRLLRDVHTRTQQDDVIFNLIAIYAHGTGFNQIFVGEFILGSWPIALGLVLYFKQKKTLD